jgi:SAM-dependent methyltransferase
MHHTRTGEALPLPPANLRFMGENDQKLIQVADDLAGLLVRHGLTASSSVLDVGCGYGRLALGLLHSTDHEGPYLGFDIQARSIDWCASTLSRRFPSMRFAHLDVRNERYNPRGSIDPTTMSFPARSASIDVCALISVFTHFFRADIERYMAEIRRVLRPGGLAVVTWFLYDEARLPLITSSEAMYPMVHELDAHTRFMMEREPLRAIAYHEEAIRAMAGAARLEIRAIERGSWTGEPGPFFQDVVVLAPSTSDTVVDPDPNERAAIERLRGVIRHTRCRLSRLVRAS